MNFINNTFLEAINFNGYDVHDTEYEVITCCAQYRLEYRQNSNHMLDSFQKIKNIGVTPEFGENSTLRNLVEYF